MRPKVRLLQTEKLTLPLSSSLNTYYTKRHTFYLPLFFWSLSIFWTLATLFPKRPKKCDILLTVLGMTRSKSSLQNKFSDMTETTGKLHYDMRYLTKISRIIRFLSIVFGVWPQNLVGFNLLRLSLFDSNPYYSYILHSFQYRNVYPIWTVSGRAVLKFSSNIHNIPCRPRLQDCP